MTSVSNSVVLLAGPTASGKSALAMEWARQTGGTIVNADAMQVYSDLRIVTARPTAEDEARVPHRLFGHVDGSRAYSVGQWLRDASDVLSAGGPHIVVGGTGLYFGALENGLATVPPIPAAIRERWRSASHTELMAELLHRDPEAAAELALTDRQRVARAVEVHDATGRTLREWQRESTNTGALAEGRVMGRILLDPDRSVLRERIARRFDRMIADGAIDEVRALLKRELDPALPVMRAIGVRELRAHLNGELSRGDAIERAMIASRQYAKRQRTWFRNRFSKEWNRCGNASDARRLLGLAT